MVLLWAREDEVVDINCTGQLCLCMEEARLPLGDVDYVLSADSFKAVLLPKQTCFRVSVERVHKAAYWILVELVQLFRTEVLW